RRKSRLGEVRTRCYYPCELSFRKQHLEAKEPLRDRSVPLRFPSAATSGEEPPGPHTRQATRRQHPPPLGEPWCPWCQTPLLPSRRPAHDDAGVAYRVPGRTQRGAGTYVHFGREGGRDPSA